MGLSPGGRMRLGWQGMGRQVALNEASLTVQRCKKFR